MSYLTAFITGGIICVIGQLLIDKTKLTPARILVLFVTLGAVLTGIGVYDRIGVFAGAGSIVPITGFSNSMTSSALESKSEGLVLGIMNNMFKLAGAVIVAGVVSAFVAGNIIYLVRVLV